MSERVRTYFALLKSLSSEDLDRSAQALAVDEKRSVARLIAHIAEIGDRGHHLELGCKSLFEYCVTRLNLSEGSVYRRTQVARVCRRFPQILDALATGRLHLTGASLIAPLLTVDNVERLIAMAGGKTRREVEKLVVTLAPKEAFAPSLRKLPSRAQEISKTVLVDDHSEVVGTKEIRCAESPPVPSAAQRTRDLLEPATEELYNFRFCAGNAFTAKFRRLAEVLGIEHPQNHMEEILDKALEIALEKKDPQRKLERRRKREAKKESPSHRPGDGGQEQKQTPKGEEASEHESKRPAPTRYISSEVRERVLERAGYQCEYCGPDRSRCRSRNGLQVEHTRPFAVHQTHDEQSLQAFCPAHNLHAARKFYGQAFIQQKIDARRRSEAAIPS